MKKYLLGLFGLILCTTIFVIGTNIPETHATANEEN